MSIVIATLVREPCLRDNAHDLGAWRFEAVGENLSSESTSMALFAWMRRRLAAVALLNRLEAVYAEKEDAARAAAAVALPKPAVATPPGALQDQETSVTEQSAGDTGGRQSTLEVASESKAGEKEKAEKEEESMR